MPLSMYSSILIRQLLAYYNLEPRYISSPQSGYRNLSYQLNLDQDTTANLILYKSEPDILAKIQSAGRVSDYLATQNLPTRKTLGPIIKMTGKTRGGIPLTKYACLYNYLPGTTIPWEAYTRDHIKLLGLAMGRMHTELAGAPRLSLPTNIIGESQALLSRMERYFAQSRVAEAMERKLNLRLNPHALASAKVTLRLAARLPNHQPIHMDFVRGNILFDPATNHPGTPFHLGELALTGIIDFEKTTTGPRLFDIARTLAFLYVDCKSKSPEQITKYFLRSGYIKRSHTTFESSVAIHPASRGFDPRQAHPADRVETIDLLQPLINFYLLHDFYKFLRHNPYEYLSQNKHFVRTVAILQKRGLLTPNQQHPLELLHANMR